MAILKNTSVDNAGFVQLPAGTTAQRPASPTVGMSRFNTDLGVLESWNGSAWVAANALLGTPVDDETPTGAVNGSNVTFTLSQTPKAGSTRLYRSGLRLKENSDFTISTATITMNQAPEVGENLICDFRY